MGAMTLREMADHIKERMVEAIDGSTDITVLAPSIFLASDTEFMADWVSNKASDQMRRKFQEHIDGLRQSDGALMRVSAVSTTRPEGREAMADVLPMLVRTFNSQCLVWAASAFEMSTEYPIDSTAEADQILEELGPDWHEHCTEVLYVIAVDREVSQTWSANVRRDDDGGFAGVDDWTLVYDVSNVHNLPYDSFTDAAQKALRSL
jgi:hypothetical protein